MHACITNELILKRHNTTNKHTQTGTHTRTHPRSCAHGYVMGVYLHTVGHANAGPNASCYWQCQCHFVYVSVWVLRFEGCGKKQKIVDVRLYAIRFRGRPRNLLGDFVRYVSQNETIPGSTPELSRAQTIGFRGPTPESTRLKKMHLWHGRALQSAATHSTACRNARTHTNAAQHDKRTHANRHTHPHTYARTHALMGV